jgi:hypothetical protein
MDEESKQVINRKYGWVPGKSGNPATQFTPGICPNPNGRKGALRDIFNEAFSKPDTPAGKSAQQDAIEKLKAACRKGNLKAIRMWLEWSLSKPPQEINVGPSENLVEYEQKKAAVMREILSSLSKGKAGESDVK